MEIADFATFNIAIVVLAVGRWLNQRFAVLRQYNIPEPVSSGLLVCLLLALVHAVSGLEINFNLDTRDFLLLYFFATIGLNADVKTLLLGGRPLLLLVGLTVAFMVLQNITGVGVASLLGISPLKGLLGGRCRCWGGMAQRSPGRRGSPGITASTTPWRSPSPAPPWVWCWPR
nr:sodium/glutamate symporter [Synechococcus sp. J7-Johnson]